MDKENLLGKHNDTFALQYQLINKDGDAHGLTEYIAYHQGKQISRGKTDENGYTESFLDKISNDVYIHLVNSNLIKA
ncbi:hypothetical protein HYE60_00710 [Aggregatibacter actinomycetemcomitans]|nr:hypothetical protein [Aggregatibacter actinomycetemcomitans]